jgi:hypothetical protein
VRVQGRMLLRIFVRSAVQERWTHAAAVPDALGLAYERLLTP